MPHLHAVTNNGKGFCFPRCVNLLAKRCRVRGGRRERTHGGSVGGAIRWRREEEEYEEGEKASGNTTGKYKKKKSGIFLFGFFFFLCFERDLSLFLKQKKSALGV